MYGEYRARLIRKFLFDHEASQINRSCPYTPRANDVIITGYFRTGTSWVQQILHQIRCAGDETYDDIDRVVYYIPPYMERFDLDLDASQPIGLTECRFFRSNDCYEDAPVPRQEDDANVKYVYLVRDPFDVAWSEGRSRYRNLGVDKDYDFFALTELNSFAADKHQFTRPIYYPTYWEQLLSWWPHRKQNTILWLHYEDLEKDLRLCIIELANFIGVNLSTEQTDRIYDYCTYEYMRQNADKFSGEYLIKLQSAMLAASPWRPIMGRVTRNDGAQSGQGALNLSEKCKAKIRWNWRHSIEPLTGHKSYAQLYASNSLIARVQARNGAAESNAQAVRFLWTL